MAHSLALVGALLVGGAFFEPAHAETVDRIAAVVDDESIALSEVYELGRSFIEERTRAEDGSAQARRSAELEVLDSLIRRRLMSQTMTRLSLDATDEEVDRAIDDVSRRHGVEREQLRKEVETSGVTWSQYRDEIREVIREQKFTQAVIGPRIVENEDEIRDAYRRLVDGSEQPQRVELGAIFLGYPSDGDFAGKSKVIARAKAARARVIAGESFAAVSAEIDQGPYGAQGGAMGNYGEGELVEMLDGPAFSTPVGTVSEPIEAPQGVFLLEIRSREAQPLRSYDEVRPELAAKVNEGRLEREKDNWYQQTRREAAVEIKLETLDGQ